MGIWIFFCVYTVMSAVGLFIIKTGTADSHFVIENGLFNIQISTRLLLGFLLYIGSFLLSLFIMSRINLSIFYPLGTGIILVITCLLGYFFLKEQLGLTQIIGIGLILSGIVVMNIK